MNTPIFIATDWKGIHRASASSGSWTVETLLPDSTVHCLAVDPVNRGRIYAGTREQGVLRSDDGGKTWLPAGLDGIPVKSLAISPSDPQVIYAGSVPVSLFKTTNGGEDWEELPAMRNARQWWWFSPAEANLKPYIQGLAISPKNPNVLMAGIELGALMRSEDGGASWTKHINGAIRDCHSVRFHHSNPNWVYEGGAGSVGAAYSRDGGKTWQRPAKKQGAGYGWKVAADPERPEVWYLSASDNPNLFRGEFTPPAHNDGNARAHIFRSAGGAPLEKLTGGLPDPLDDMAYALEIDPQAPGHLYAGLANGDVWHTADYGDSWQQLPFNLGGVHREMVVVRS